MITVAELLAGKRPQMPSLISPYGTAAWASPQSTQLGFDELAADGDDDFSRGVGSQEDWRLHARREGSDADASHQQNHQECAGRRYCQQFANKVTNAKRSISYDGPTSLPDFRDSRSCGHYRAGQRERYAESDPIDGAVR